MSLDNKIKQEKLFAFEINSILKGLRQLAQNIIDLNKIGHWEYISSAGGASVAVPPNANFAVINFGWYPNGFSEYHMGQVTLARNGATSATHIEGKLYTSSGTSASGVSVSWSGSTITISSAANIVATSMNMNISFYT